MTLLSKRQLTAALLVNALIGLTVGAWGYRVTGAVPVALTLGGQTTSILNLVLVCWLLWRG